MILLICDIQPLPKVSHYKTKVPAVVPGHPLSPMKTVEDMTSRKVTGTQVRGLPSLTVRHYLKKPRRYHGECCASGGPKAKTTRGRRPQGFWPWDLPRHNVHHDTSKVFSFPEQLLKSSCLSVGWSVRWSVGPSVR